MAEEIDDDSVIDNWEDFEENLDVLDKHIKKMTIYNDDTVNKTRETIIVNEEEAQRSSTFNSQEPKIMILRRPQKVQEEVGLPNGTISQKQKIPLKSLQQRQAEYAEARLRILGNSGPSSSSLSPEEITKPESMDNKLQVNPTTFDNNFPEKTQLTQMMTIASSGSGKPVAFIKPVTSVKPVAFIKPVTSVKPVAFIKPVTSVNVLRSPRGPDSNFGFQSNSGKNGPS